MKIISNHYFKIFCILIFSLFQIYSASNILKLEKQKLGPIGYRSLSEKNPTEKLNLDWSIDSMVLQVWEGSWRDSSLVIFNYAENQNIRSSIYKIQKDGEWTNYLKNEYYYDNGRKCSLNVLIWSDQSWQNNHQFEYKYDKNGNILEEISKNWTNEQWEPISKKIHKYGNDSYKDSTLSQIMDDNDNWQTPQKSEYYYDNNSNRDSVVHKFCYQDTYLKSEVYVHNFKKGLKTQTIYRKWDYSKNICIDTTRTLFEYNTDDSLIKKTVQVPEKGLWRDSSQVSHHYNNNRLSSIVYELYKNENWIYRDSTSYNYNLEEKTCIILMQEWQEDHFVNNRRWKLDYVDESNRVIGSDNSQNYKLYPAYPNPFNSSTEIEYYLKSKSPVKITIYNIQGQILNSLVNTVKSKGLHSTTWKPKNIPSGIYFYKIQANRFSEVKKCILLK